MAFFDLKTILQVITSPNSAFSQIRENEEKYFAQSVSLVIILSVLSGLSLLPGYFIPLDNLELEGMDLLGVGLSTQPIDIPIQIVASILGQFLFAFLLFFIGKKLGGEKTWKKMFSVYFHTLVPGIPLAIILIVLGFFAMDSFSSMDLSIFDQDDIGPEAFVSMAEFLGFAILMGLVGVIVLVWTFILTIKAVKVVHGFETGKAFGLALLVTIIHLIVLIPIG